MSRYDNRLEDLLQLTQARAIQPLDAVQTMWGLQDQRREQRLAKQQAADQARADLLDSLVSTAQTAASEGSTMGEVKPLLDSLAMAAGSPSMPYGKIPAIDPLFQGGISTVNPDIDAKDASIITNKVFENIVDADGVVSPLNVIRDRIHAEIAPAYGPEYARLVQSLDAVIEAAYKQATQGM